MAQAPDLDLAFDADPELGAELLAAAGVWADALGGAEPWHALLSDWLGQLADELPQERQAAAYSLGLSLVGDSEIAALNADWRQKDGPTDVLSFAALDESSEGAPAIPLPAWAGEAEALELGDIVISLDTAARQAQEQGHSLERELLFLASHGLLHLLGWDHPDEASLAAMLARQEQLLSSAWQR